jgi:hypothetical protein
VGALLLGGHAGPPLRKYANESNCTTSEESLVQGIPSDLEKNRLTNQRAVFVKAWQFHDEMADLKGTPFYDMMMRIQETARTWDGTDPIREVLP